MDGWALGKTKVFLKYYHVEFLSKLYEEQLRKIVIVQACVRRWLARLRFRKQKWQFAVSVVTLQRHIRGWLSRKHTMRMLAERHAKETTNAEFTRTNFQNTNPDRESPIPGRGSFIARRDLSSADQMKSGEGTPADANNREKQQQRARKSLQLNDAAIVIQSRKCSRVRRDPSNGLERLRCFVDFRGYTIRKRFGYELEERFKRILNDHDNVYDGHKALLREGLRHEDAALIVQRWYKKEERAARRKPIATDPVHPKLRQADLIEFSQNVISCHSNVSFFVFFTRASKSIRLNCTFTWWWRTQVHMKNQELHKNLRRNKPGVRLNELEESPHDYARPEGFNVMRSVLRPYRSGAQSNEEDSVKYYRDLKEEMSR